MMEYRSNPFPASCPATVSFNSLYPQKNFPSDINYIKYREEKEFIREAIRDSKKLEDMTIDLIIGAKHREPSFVTLQGQLIINLFTNLVVSGAIALGIKYAFNLGEISASIIFAACLIQGLHKSGVAICMHLSEVARVGNTVAALAIQNAYRENSKRLDKAGHSAAK
jgi:hypothetical protein